MFIYLDTETTGSGTTDRLCQIAFKTDTGTTSDELFNPNMPISVEATRCERSDTHNNQWWWALFAGRLRGGVC